MALSATDMPADAVEVVAALIQHRGELLICQRRAGDVFGLKWEFPGGKVNPGESLVQALARELMEELDLAATIGEELLRTTFNCGELRRTVNLHFFPASIDEDAALQNNAFEQFAWVAPGKLMEYDFLPADRELIEKIARGDLQL